MITTQEDVDSAVDTLNKYIDSYNESQGYDQIRPLSVKKRQAFLRSKQELEDLLKTPMDNTLGLFYRESGNIYINKDKLGSHFDQISDQGALNPIPLSANNVKEIGLLTLLAHENVHRSCNRKQQPSHYHDFFMGALKTVYGPTDLSQDIEDLDREQGKFYNNGLILELHGKKGIFSTKYNENDELMTQVIATQLLSGPFVAQGYMPRFVKNGAELSKILILNLIDFKNEIETGFGLDLGNKIINHPQYSLIVKDYLSGEIPLKFVDHMYPKNSDSSKEWDTLLRGTLSLIIGNLDSLELILSSIYGSPQLST